MADRDPVCIEWTDSAIPAVPGWRNADYVDAMVPQIFISIGWVFKEDDRTITLVSSVSEDDDNFGGIVCIPKAAIRKRKKVKV